MKHKLYIARTSLLLAVMVIMSTGCAAPIKRVFRTSAKAEMKADFIREHKKMALKYGNQGKIKKALEQWEIVAALDIEDAEAQRRIENTRTQIDRAVERALNKARWYERKGKTDSALKHYIVALKFDTDNTTAYEALQQISKKGMLKIKPKPIGKGYTHPVTKKPLATKKTSAKTSATKKTPLCDIAKGKRLLLKKRSAEAISLFRQCIKQTPGDQNILNLLRKSYYKNLKLLVQKNRFSEAKNKLEEALIYFPEDSSFISIVAGVEVTTVEEKTPADKKAQVKSLVDQAKKLRKEGDLEGALQRWEDVLDIQPGYPGADAEVANIRNEISIKILLNKASGFKKKGKYDKAVEEWNKVLGMDARNKEAREGIAEVEARVVDTYYRQGLIHYKNQRLEQAIQQWEKLLIIDPDHKKAKIYINKARRMLKKLEEIDATSRQ